MKGKGKCEKKVNAGALTFSGHFAQKALDKVFSFC
jgi:hypothetical protein